MELLARIRALLRRTNSSKSLPNDLSFGDVEIDFLRYVARRCGKTVEMTRKEFAILRLLGSRTGEVVTRDELLNEVWVSSRIRSLAPWTTTLPDFEPSSKRIRRGLFTSEPFMASDTSSFTVKFHDKRFTVTLQMSDIAMRIFIAPAAYRCAQGRPS